MVYTTEELDLIIGRLESDLGTLRALARQQQYAIGLLSDAADVLNTIDGRTIPEFDLVSWLFAVRQLLEKS